MLHFFLFFWVPKVDVFNHNAEINIGFIQDMVENLEALILDLWFPVNIFSQIFSIWMKGSMATGPFTFKISHKAANECIWRQVRRTMTVILKGGNSFGLLCWSCILELILIPLLPPVSQKVWLYLAHVHFFLKGVHMLQCSTAYCDKWS